MSASMSASVSDHVQPFPTKLIVTAMQVLIA